MNNSPYNNKIFVKLFVIICMITLFHSCGIIKPVDARKVPQNALERAKKNVEEGRGVSLKNLTGGGKTSYEFSTSNPMWRATLETIDFLPLTNVDYSGGIISSDWYNNDGGSEYLKITIRFLSNEVLTSSLKIIVHKKKCESSNNNCSINLVNNSKIEDELAKTILKKAALLEKNNK